MKRWPVLVGLCGLIAIFQLANPNFLSPLNLTNLLLQIAAMGVISTGVVLVLLLGMIDLSAGAVSGLCAGVMAVLSVKHGVPGAFSVVIALSVGTLIGAAQGTWIARVRVPAFVVTLAGLMVWQGALLFVLGSTGSVNVRDPFILSLANTFFPSWMGLFAAVIILGSAVLVAISRRRIREAAGLPLEPVQRVMLRFGAGLLAMAVILVVTSADRGVPLAVVILGIVIAGVDVLVTRTRLGRHILAVGSNEDAAARAGISVVTVRVLVFTLSALLAALGGVLASSRLMAVSQASGGGDLLLNAIAAAVIGGTSLFGGRGSAWSALLGALVIGSISNGMDLLALESSIKFMVTGAVLLGAVSADAVSRRKR